jgi:hypothetical protein
MRLYLIVVDFQQPLEGSKAMKHLLLLFLLILSITFSTGTEAAPVEVTSNSRGTMSSVGDLDVSIRLIGGEGSVLMPGRDINLTFQTNANAYVIVYNIDSEGYVHLLHPADGRPRIASGKKIYFLPEQGKGIIWEVGDRTGIEYIHAIAVENPEMIDRDELYYLARNSSLQKEDRLRIDMDPFLAFNMIDEELVGEFGRTTVATDYTHFYVNRQVDYPGYLCYKCHTPSKIADPYAMECSEVAIEMVGAAEETGYPYDQLYAVIHLDESGDDYESFSYYADNLDMSGDYDYGNDYDDTKVYLSVYYAGGYHPYNYWWPGWSGWYGGYPSWYWDSYWGFGWGFGFGMGWGWGGYYCHHYPFYSWYPSYHAYWHGYHHGYWDGYYHGGGYYPVYHPGRSVYAGRSFKKRPIDYNLTAVKTKRDRTIASSRMTTERVARSTARSMERSRLARGISREKASSGLRTLDPARYNTRRSSKYTRDNRIGAYETQRSARGSSYNRKTRQPAANTKRKTVPSAGRRNRPVDYDDRGRESKSRKSTNTRNERKDTGTTRRSKTDSRATDRKERDSKSGTSARSSSGSKKTRGSESKSRNRSTGARSSGSKSTRSAPRGGSSGSSSRGGSSSGRSSGKKSRKR